MTSTVQLEQEEDAFGWTRLDKLSRVILGCFPPKMKMKMKMKVIREGNKPLSL